MALESNEHTHKTENNLSLKFSGPYKLGLANYASSVKYISKDTQKMLQSRITRPSRSIKGRKTEEQMTPQTPLMKSQTHKQAQQQRNHLGTVRRKTTLAKLRQNHAAFPKHQRKENWGTNDTTNASYKIANAQAQQHRNRLGMVSRKTTEGF